jgi:hypothetical protein
MELSSKKKNGLHTGKERKKRESSIVSSLQIPKGDPWKIRITTQGHILSKAQ